MLVTGNLGGIASKDFAQEGLASTILMEFVGEYGRCPSIADFDGSIATEDEANFVGVLYRKWFPGAVDLVESRSFHWEA